MQKYLCYAFYTCKDLNLIANCYFNISRLDQFLQVHRKCYMLCQAPLHGKTERQIFSLIQNM